jgi:hypothetical protein
MKDVDETLLLQPSPVLLDVLSAEQRGAVNHLVRGVSSSCPPTDPTRVLCPPPILTATPLS